MGQTRNFGPIYLQSSKDDFVTGIGFCHAYRGDHVRNARTGASDDNSINIAKNGAVVGTTVGVAVEPDG